LNLGGRWKPKFRPPEQLAVEYQPAKQSQVLKTGTAAFYFTGDASASQAHKTS
jgi:hypothetical protein